MTTADGRPRKKGAAGGGGGGGAGGGDGARRKTTRRKATGARKTGGKSTGSRKATGAGKTARKTARKTGAKKAAAGKTTARKKAAPRKPQPPPAPHPGEAFPSTVSEDDLARFAGGVHARVHEVLGAHVRTLKDADAKEVTGTSFAVWAPAARSVSVVGPFCDDDPARWPLRPLGTSGVHERFVPGIGADTAYKFSIETADGERLLKTDPYGRWMEPAPDHSSRVQAAGTYTWGDEAWLAGRADRDLRREPFSVYEVHLGSWARVPEEDNRSLSYREIAPHLVEHVQKLGFTHVELMPVMEHPFGGSWGYQVTGYFAPTSRYGTPDDLRFLVDSFHQAGIGVIFDWVPAHFPADEHGLGRFDGTALYEHEDPRKGKHPDWDTLIFNYGRHEVANLLLANTLYWIEEFHADGLRVDAVASMLYLDYSREPGEWVPNDEGGRENLDAVRFLEGLSTLVRAEAPGCLLVAEESTTWPGVTTPVEEGGLGFHFKWNLGWMHDTLRYFATDPLYRAHHHGFLTFAHSYEHTEHFLMPLSHDEVVHEKGSLLAKMHGDEWQKLANLRLLLAWQFLRTGKKLLFMGTELASLEEWDHDGSLHWHLRDEPSRQGLQAYLAALNKLYKHHPCLWAHEEADWNFLWIECEDKENSVFSFQRRDEDTHLLVVLNTTPIPREGHRVGAPSKGRYRLQLSSDEERYGGTGHELRATVATEDVPHHGHDASLLLDLPPLGALVLAPE